MTFREKLVITLLAAWDTFAALFSQDHGIPCNAQPREQHMRATVAHIINEHTWLWYV